MATDFDNIASDAEEAQERIPLIRSTSSLGAGVTPSRLTLEELLAETRQYLTEQDIEKIQHAYDLASQAHQGAVRRSGEPYIQHPLEVAFLLAVMQIDADGIAAALLHDVVEDTDYTLEDLRTQFGAAVAHIVDGVTKFNALAGKSPTDVANGGKQTELPPQPQPPSLVDKRRMRIETVRKMLLAMTEDPRVVVLKIADRLHNMRTLSVMSPVQQQNTARETTEIYAPLSRRLGMALAQADLEDLAFQVLEPEKYKRLARLVEEEIKRRLPFIKAVCDELQAEMKKANIRATVLSWQKHLASINRKLNDVPSGIDDKEVLSQLHDLISFRILVDTDYECYLALGHIHALWRPKDGRIKDFIATPKVNGYQSLHTTVFCLENRLAEIQIRTHEMQRIADYGLASYWYLKERMGKDAGGSWRLSYKEMVAWIEQLREWQQALPRDESADEFVEAVKGDIFQEQIFVFTPKGEVKDLPRGSTPLDMAYRIHTDIGDHCAGARIITNMDESGRLVTRLVPLDYELKGGEIVDIMTSRTVHPTRDWLSFARTAAARNKVRRYLKTYEREINLQLGHERLDLALKASGVDSVDSTLEEVLKRVGKEDVSVKTMLKKDATVEDIYVALGREDLRVEDVLEPLLAHLPGAGARAAESVHNGRFVPKENESINLVHLAQCCCPIPGDMILGLLAPDQGMVVHRCDCTTLRRQQESEPRHRLIEVNWRQIMPESYLVPISIVAHDRAGLLRDVAAVVADAGINMISVTSTTNTAVQKSVITATLEISGVSDTVVLEQIEAISRRLRQVKSVVNVERAVEK